MSEEPVVKYKIAWPDLEACKVVVNLSLTVGQWRGYLQHCEKTGNTIARKIGEQVQLAIDEVDKAK